jgi:hypothetical protein
MMENNPELTYEFVKDSIANTEKELDQLEEFDFGVDVGREKMVKYDILPHLKEGGGCQSNNVKEFVFSEYIEIDSFEFIQEYLEVMFNENGIEGLHQGIAHIARAKEMSLKNE